MGAATRHPLRGAHIVTAQYQVPARVCSALRMMRRPDLAGETLGSTVGLRMETARSQDREPHRGVLERNIEALLERRRAEERGLGWQERTAEVVTRFSGSMRFVYLHLALYGLWVAINVGWIPAIPKFDPTFVILAMEASVEAIFLSTFILITQNRMMAQADKRADLNLQISLLAEHEVTRLLQLVRVIAARLNIQEAAPAELDDLEKDVRPVEVLDTIEKHVERAEREASQN